MNNCPLRAPLEGRRCSDLKALYCLDGIITVVDAARVKTHLDEEMFKGAQNKFVVKILNGRVSFLSAEEDGSILAVSSGTESFGFFFSPELWCSV